MNSLPVIEVHGLWKRYGLPLPSFLQKAAGLLTRSSERTDTLPWALKEINFTLNKGENLGIIGRNGAGKSTLLKVLAGVSPPTKGEYVARGRIFPMIELQAGTNPDLTGNENIMLLGAVAGFSPSQINSRFASIAEFSELGDWLARPVRMYSSGMQARLAFSVAIHADADILLIDEVLGVGDYRFQKKCIDRLERMRLAQDTSIVLVSHNPYQVQRLCDKVLMLDGGAQAHFGDASQALDLYFSADDAGAQTGIALPDARDRDGSGRLRITNIELLDAEENPIACFRTGETGILRLHYSTNGPASNPNFGIRVLDQQSTCLLSFAYTSFMNGQTLEGDGHIDCKIDRVPLLGGSYYLQIKVSGHELFDMIHSAPGLTITSEPSLRIDTANMGVFHQPAHWTIVERKTSNRNAANVD